MNRADAARRAHSQNGGLSPSTGSLWRSIRAARESQAAGELAGNVACAEDAQRIVRLILFSPWLEREAGWRYGRPRGGYGRGCPEREQVRAFQRIPPGCNGPCTTSSFFPRAWDVLWPFLAPEGPQGLPSRSAPRWSQQGQTRLQHVFGRAVIGRRETLFPQIP